MCLNASCVHRQRTGAAAGELKSSNPFLKKTKIHWKQCSLWQAHNKEVEILLRLHKYKNSNSSVSDSKQISHQLKTVKENTFLKVKAVEMSMMCWRCKPLKRPFKSNGTCPQEHFWTWGITLLPIFVHLTNTGCNHRQLHKHSIGTHGLYPTSLTTHYQVDFIVSSL